MTIIPDFNSLKKNLKKEIQGSHKLKLAVMGDSATQFLTLALKGYGFEVNTDLDIYEAPYNQIGMQLQNPSSDLYSFRPKYVLIYESSKKLQKEFCLLPINERQNFASIRLNKIEQYYEIVSQKLNAILLYYNFTEINDGIFGSYANKFMGSFLFQLRKLNVGLSELSTHIKNLFVPDLLSLQTIYGSSLLADPKVYIQTDMLLSTDFLPYVAKITWDQILSIEGQFKKCLILDLDNTLWGGVIGDDGINNIQIGGLGIGKVFSEIQQWAKELKNRGIIICIVSKNTEEIAKEPFEKHSEMVLHLDDISVFMANWDNKVKNIQRIQEILNIGFDSMVFVDDNPFERNMVRENIKDITIPELPEDSSLILNYLISLNLFETASVSENDELRTLQYQEESKRVKEKFYFDNEDDFLKNLEMFSLVEDLTEFNLPRVAQLTQRSNQFNLRTIRCTEEELLHFVKNPDNYILNFHLSDKYGDLGLIAIIMVKKSGTDLFIENWIMSCRVLKRGMENFTLKTIVKLAKEKGITTITGEYIPSPKNMMVKDHYLSLGFYNSGPFWKLELKDYQNKTTFIKQI